MVSINTCICAPSSFYSQSGLTTRRICAAFWSLPVTSYHFLGNQVKRLWLYHGRTGVGGASGVIQLISESSVLSLIFQPFQTKSLAGLRHLRIKYSERPSLGDFTHSMKCFQWVSFPVMVKSNKTKALLTVQYCVVFTVKWYKALFKGRPSRSPLNPY